MMWNWYNGGWGGFGGFWIMPVIMIIVLGLIIWGIVAFSRRAGWASGAGCCGNSPVSSDSALDILKRRYAQGEINKQQFNDMKKDLI